jgi:hypothetical protein
MPGKPLSVWVVCSALRRFDGLMMLAELNQLLDDARANERQP